MLQMTIGTMIALAIVDMAPCCLADSSNADATLEFRVLDDGSKPIPCRIHIRNASGEAQKPSDLPFWHDHFVCPGTASINVTPGEYTWTIERGPEYQPQTGSVTASASQTTSVEITLERISHLRKDGWYSGDLHVHRPVQDIELLMQAEDLDFAPVITWWNTRSFASEAATGRTVRFDGHRIYATMAGEDERQGGALLYFGLKRPLDLTAESREIPSPMKFVGEARRRNPNVWIDIEKPFWWDVPTWLATGQMNSIGLANNHMCRSQMYPDEAWGRPRDTIRLPSPHGNGYWTQEIYYHALNAGLRIPPSAGSASGVLPNPVGYNRVYVHLDQEFTRDSWFEGLSRGRCFVTNGPLLKVTANQQQSGIVMTMPDKGELNVAFSIDLTSVNPVAALQVVHNGRVIHTIATDSGRSHHAVTSIRLREPGWFLVRAITEVRQAFRFASTAPWYVESTAGKNPIRRESAEFFQDWVEQRIEQLRRNVSDPAKLRPVLEPHEQARIFWADRAAAGTNAR